ncbi:MAG: hypothetical protein KIT09_30475 [Bryobacteraceae bacterium]|nr:hypothetical protein [Bryobacteraceae bacterium]
MILTRACHEEFVNLTCEKTGRQARLVEIDPKYCDVVLRRWQQYGGGRATHAASGLGFDELAKAAA